ncbi:hypothetical protein TsFJ059_001524 [Trichoderma semiorbis]|uniref:Uncharacterized protein n=1 Tax=Trichoderma semiorbis TaxID=1491008 RepID=A0A9P8I3L0_9HYPO|nr:hypothetical protein TsFJ059_001524 [Trichoderma semiorbis]
MSGHAKSSHKHAGGGRHSTNNLHPDPRSFLFVINELKVTENDNYYEGDDWWNRIPRSNSSGYDGETPGRVMRYHNRGVTEAFGYGWYRGDFNGRAWPAGGVLMCSSDGLPMYTEDGMPQYVAVYKKLSVFSCGPFLPIVVINGDPLTADLSSSETPSPMPLMFHHPPLQEGISHAVYPEGHMERGPGPCKYVAGANPSWMPSLVPTIYSNPNNPGPSNGLAGELPIILGLMAFSEPTRSEEVVNRIFLGEGSHRGKWRDGQWHRTEAPRGYALSADAKPLGFLVTVLFDPENPEYSNKESLEAMEWTEVIVRESRR